MVIPRVKLMALWFGDLPSWYDKFQDRIAANGIIDFELILLPNFNHFCDAVQHTLHLQFPVRKESPHALCDLRPFYPALFHTKIFSYQWWGWCDLDIVLGDLDKLLPPLLDAHDVLRFDDGGPLSIFRNKPEVNELWRQISPTILATPEYLNFDEDGFGPDNSNDSIERIFQNSGLRICHDDRVWEDKRDLIEGIVPARCCELRGDDLIEVPTGRELILYHFTQLPKRWPLPNRWRRQLGMQLKRLEAVNESAAPKESPEFWASRLQRVVSDNQPLHVAVYSTTGSDWVEIQRHSVITIKDNVEPGQRILDAGCGYGALWEALRSWGCADPCYDYTGVDYCAEMIACAKGRNPSREFIYADIRSLPFADDAFDVVVCRGLEGSVKTLIGIDAWNTMQQEMLRVAPKLLLINLSRECRVVERSKE